jgi:phospholipase C
VPVLLPRAGTLQRRSGGALSARAREPYWARPHFVSHEVYDHTSILKLVETKWNLPALTYRDANAAPMLDMLDLRRPSFAEPPGLAPPLAVADPSALSCSVTGPGTIPPAGSVTG